MDINESVRIGNIRLKNRLVLAPMAGITNMAFRIIAKEFGAALVHTEMISAKGLFYKQKHTYDYLRHTPQERPISFQIFGSEPNIMADAAKIAIEHGADIVDINMGCPVKKVVKTGAGAALLKDLKRAEEIIRAVRKVCTVPLTIKIRAGWSQEKPVYLDILKIAEENGVDAVTIHARFASQGFSGRVDWEIIRKAKERSNLIIIGNGDLFSYEDAKRMIDETGCDLVMIARGAIGNPWIFNGEIPSLEERKRVMLRHFSLIKELIGERRAIKYIRGVFIWYSKGLPLSRYFRERVSRVESEEELISLLKSYFSMLEEKGYEDKGCKECRILHGS